MLEMLHHFLYIYPTWLLFFSLAFLGKAETHRLICPSSTEADLLIEEG